MTRRLKPADNKFHKGNGDDGKHYWLTPPDLYAELDAEFAFDHDPAPFPLPEGFDGLTDEWGQSNYVNPPFGAILHEGKRKGATAWVRKAIAENAKGKRVVLVYPIDKWILMLLKAGAEVRNLGDVKWLATEDGTPGNGTGRHIACFVLEPKAVPTFEEQMMDRIYAMVGATEAITDGNRLEQPTELSVEKTVAPKSRTTLRREAAQRGEEPPQFDGADTVRDDEADGIEAVRRYRRERADQHLSGRVADEASKE